MNKNVDVLALMLVLAGFACVSLVQNARAQCARMALIGVTARLTRPAMVDVELPKLCLSHK